MFKYQGVNLIKTVYRPYAPLISSLFFTGFSSQLSWRKFIGFDYKLQDALIIDGVYYYPDYHLQTFAARAVRHILKDQKNFLHLKRETLRREKAIRVKSKGTDLKTFFIAYLNYQPTLALYHICDDFIENSLRQELAKKTAAAEVDELMSHLNLPLKLNLDQKMKKWFLKTRDVSGFIKKYSWNFSRYGQHHFLTRAEATAFLNTLKKDKSLGGLENRLATKQAVKKAKTILGKKAYYVDVMQFFIYYRTHRTDILNQTFFNYYDQLVAFAKRFKLGYADFINCSYEELTTGQIPNRKTLQARRKGAIVCFSHGRIKIISGPAINHFRKLCRDKGNSGSVTGRSAFSGLVSGLVRIVKSKKDFSNFKKGNILVASMTTPAMMPIMKKAAAFVTDEGGITCHAAILARELKKPCIIGTKIATKVLRSGDEVEVDADKGIVKKI